MPTTVSYRSFNDLYVSAGDLTSPSEDPYIYTPYLCRTLPQLLGIANQFLHADDMNAPVVFEVNFSLYSREIDNNTQWVSQGLDNGSPLGQLASVFTTRGGLTKNDIVLLGTSVANGTLDSTWR